MVSIDAYLKKLINTIDIVGERIVDKVSLVAQKHAKASRAFKGNVLRRNINIIYNGMFARTVIADKFYAYWVEFGNNQKGPYIYPKRAKALHFWINGKEIFAKRVRAHGPLPFMRPAGDFARKKAKGIMVKELNKWVK